MQLNNNISLGTLKFCYIRYFLLKQYFCAMLCVYAFKQLVGENEMTTILVLKIRLEILYF